MCNTCLRFIDFLMVFSTPVPSFIIIVCEQAFDMQVKNKKRATWPSFYFTSVFFTHDIMRSNSTRSDLICMILYFLPLAKLAILSPVANVVADFLSVTVWPTFNDLLPLELLPLDELLILIF